LKLKRWQKRNLWRRRFFRILKGTLLLSIILFSGYKIYDFLIQSQYFKVKNIRIEGNQEIDRDDILRALDIKEGENIFKAELRKARKGLMSLKQIRNIDISRDFPDTIVLKITERVPVAEVYGGVSAPHNRVELIDEGGVTFFGKPRKVPRILGAKDSPARKEVVDFLVKVIAVDSEFYKKISYIDGNNPRRIKLKIDQGLLIWGPVGGETEEELERKLGYLNLVLNDLVKNNRAFNYLDLRFLKEGKGEIIVG